MSKLKVEIVIEFDTEEELRLVMDQIFDAAERSAKDAKNAARVIKGEKDTRFAARKHAARKQRTADLLEAIGDALDTATIKPGSNGPIAVPGEEVKIGDTLLGWALARVVNPEWQPLKKLVVTSISDGHALTENGDQFKLAGYLYRVAPRIDGEGS